MPCPPFLFPEWPKRAQVTRSGWDLIGIFFFQVSVAENDNGERTTMEGKRGQKGGLSSVHWVAEGYTEALIPRESAE